MARGLAPKMKVKVFNLKEGVYEIKDVSMEIHHKYLPQRGGSQKAHEIWNLENATPWRACFYGSVSSYWIQIRKNN